MRSEASGITSYKHEERTKKAKGFKFVLGNVNINTQNKMMIKQLSGAYHARL